MESETKVTTWGQVNEQLQGEHRHMKKEQSDKSLITSLENVTVVRQKLRKHYEATTALRAMMK